MRILHIANMNKRSGVASFLMNYYRHIDKKKYYFDFISHNISENNYQEEINQLGGNLYIVPNYKKNIFKYIICVYKIIKNRNYDIIHCHEFLLSVISLFIAKITGIKVRIIHSHNDSISESIKKILIYILKNNWFFFATHYFACSKMAALFLFGKKYKVKIINNAIEPEKYYYNLIKRNIIRNELFMTNNSFLIGYVARFAKQKNHLFLIFVFKEILNKRKDSYLLLVGEGILLNEIKKVATSLNIINNIIFFGITDTVNELYSAMDVFVFPSKYEGLGIVGIEAQCAGLPVIASLNIPKEMQVTNLVHWLDIREDPEKWADKILKFSDVQERVIMPDIITKNGYNIRHECKRLEIEYDRLIKEKNN